MAVPEPKIELMDGAVVPGSTRIVDEAYAYSEADQIGEGTYGKVYRGTDRGGAKVALKMIRMDNEKEGFPITAIREIKLLSALKHENIVNLREIVRSRVHKESKYKGDIFMVFDYAEYDLTGMMDATKAQPLKHQQIKCIMHQLLRGLSYCHSNGILHRDLKASNLLINRQGVLKIADFGLARNFNTDQQGKLTNRVITLWYRPPELLLGAERYGPEVDVWSVGCIFAELLARKPLFPGNNEQQQLDCIFKLMGAPSEQNWPGVSQLEFFHNVKTSAYKSGPQNFDDWCQKHQVPADAQVLLKAMLQLDPSKRITAMDATLNDYFYKRDPPMCEPRELPRLPDCHEWTTKKRRHAAHQQQQAAQQQSHSHSHGHSHGSHGHHHAGYGHHGHMQPGAAVGYGGAPVPIHPHAHHAAAAAAAAAAGGYGGLPQRGPPGQGDRNVRPRHSGSGLPPGGVPPGPVPGQAGFKPGAKPIAGGPPGYGAPPPYAGGPPPGGHMPPGPYGAPPGYGPPPGGGYGPPPGQQQQQQRGGARGQPPQGYGQRR